MESGSDGPAVISLSFDTEILSFLWNAYDKLRPTTGTVPPNPTTTPQIIQLPGTGQNSPSGNIFQILISPSQFHQPNHHNAFVSCVQYTVVTSGILIVVGIGSYVTYNFLRKLNQTNFSTIFTELLTKASKSTSGRRIPVKNTISRSRDNESWDKKKPHSSAPNNEKEQGGKRRSKTIRKVVSGDESESDLDESEIQPEYFGPFPFPGVPVRVSGPHQNHNEGYGLGVMGQGVPTSPTDSAYNTS